MNPQCLLRVASRLCGWGLEKERKNFLLAPKTEPMTEKQKNRLKDELYAIFIILAYLWAGAFVIQSIKLGY